MSGHIKAFKVKARDKYKNNKLMLFCINDEKLLGKYKAKIRDLKILNEMLYRSMMKDIQKLKQEHMATKFILTFVV